MKKEQALTNARVDMMLSQIQPHFIYNSLTAIIGLVDVDHNLAKESIVSFADYLRTNLDSLKEVKLVPFSKELEHCKTYLRFEQLRFDNIETEFNLEITDFYLPVLTVQPLIENSIKHGLSVLENGGKVILSTYDCGDEVKIVVEDNGAGFDCITINEDLRPHIGIFNVRKRLADMCGGTLEVKSKPGEGTCVTLIIPKSEDN